MYLTFEGATVPNSTRSYESIIIEGTRDFLVHQQLKFRDLDRLNKWSQLVRFIRVSKSLV